MAYHLKLIRGMSYTGIVNATAKNPNVYIQDRATADKAVASGYFIYVEGVSQKKDEAVVSESAYGGKTLEEMNKSELETFAAYRDVEVKGAKSKAEIIAKLRKALPADELEGEISYGSPTMQELQG